MDRGHRAKEYKFYRLQDRARFVEEVTSKLYATGEHSDVRIVLDDGSSYNLHKVILAAHSPVLRKMFKRNPGKVYHLGLVTKRAFEEVLSLLYLQEISESHNGMGVWQWQEWIFGFVFLQNNN